MSALDWTGLRAAVQVKVAERENGSAPWLESATPTATHALFSTARHNATGVVHLARHSSIDQDAPSQSQPLPLVNLAARKRQCIDTVGKPRGGTG